MGKVLFVDDEQLILNSLERGLRKKDFECYYAISGKVALSVLEQNDIDVVFSDMKMPEMNGLELLKIIDEKYPSIVKGIISGYAQLPQLIATVNQTNIFKYISKPFDIYEELVPMIEEALEYAKYRKGKQIETKNLESKNKAYTNILRNMNSKASKKETKFDLIRIYHQVLTKTLKEQISDDDLNKMESIKYVESYKKFGDLFLNEILKNGKYYKPLDIINEVEMVLKQEKYKLKIEKGVDGSSKNPYEGRGMHIKPIIISIIQDLVPMNILTTVNIVVTEVSRDEKNVEVMYIVEFMKDVVNNINLENYNFRMYKSLINLFGGDIKVKETESKIDIILKVRLHLAEKDELDELTNS